MLENELREVANHKEFALDWLSAVALPTFVSLATVTQTATRVGNDGYGYKMKMKNIKKKVFCSLHLLTL